MASHYLKVTAEPHVRPEDMAAIEHAVYRYNMVVTNDWAFTQVAFFVRDEAERIHGGILGGIWGNWLHINFLWVADGLRRQGFGTRLLEAAEAQARDKGCRGVFLETHGFQARPFYERYGYEIVGEIPDYPPGHGYYLMRKFLTSDIK
jgi:GNAT superfamily N-acetyltransferase